MRTILALVLCLGSCTSPVRAEEAKELVVMMNEGESLFAAGRYDAALSKFDEAAKAAKTDEGYTKAVLRAVACETHLGRHEHALDRVRAARLPADVGLRALVLGTRAEMLFQVEAWYGFPEETEEGATGSAKISKATARGERESALAALYADREALARIPLTRFGDFILQKDIDVTRYPALWDFVVLQMGRLLASGIREGTPADPMPFIGESFAESFDARQPAAVRLGALYEQTTKIPGKGIDRAAANERWQVERVLLPERFGLAQTDKARDAYRDAATARLLAMAASLRTPAGRGEAGLGAALLLRARNQMVRALSACDSVIAGGAPGPAYECRQVREAILRHEIELVAHAARLPARGALALKTRNLEKVYFRIYSLDPMREVGTDFWSSTFSRPSEEMILRVLLRDKAQAEWTFTTGDPGEHRIIEKNVDVPSQRNGLFLVVASDDASFQPKRSLITGAVLNVTDLALARVEGRDIARYYAFDAAQGGAPAAWTRIHVAHKASWNMPKVEKHTQADQNGVAEVLLAQGETDALAEHGGSIAFFSRPLYHYPSTPEPSVKLFLLADRPIYRPGQEIKARVTAVRRAGDGSFAIASGQTILVRLHDSNRRELLSQTVKTSDMGSASVTFQLPQKGLLGVYGLQATLVGEPNVVGSLAVRVEEYKRPEFEITLDTPKDPARYGQSMSISGHAKYYFGGAAPELTIKYKVTRRRFVPWWLFWRGESAETEIARGQVKTDKQGAFHVTFVPAPDPQRVPSEQEDIPDISDFVLHVEGHDAGGRTIEAQSSIRVGAQSLLCVIDAERGFAFSDEKPALRARLMNLAEAPAAGPVSWELHRLGPRPQAKRKRKAPLPFPGGLEPLLADYPNAGLVTSGRLDIGKEGARLELPATLAAGGYRLTMTTLDPFGQTIRGTRAFLVVDAQTRTLPLELPAIALVREPDLQAGQRAHFLVGSSRASGTYHVELWRGETLDSDMVSRGAPVRAIELPVSTTQAGGFTLRWLGADGIEVVGDEVMVNVPRKDKELHVAFTERRAQAKPGEHVKWAVEVKDGQGRPVAGESLVAVYDRSLELYAKNAPSWVDALYAPPRAPSVRDDAQREGFASEVRIEPGILKQLAEKIRGGYKEPEVPRFSWQTGIGFGKDNETPRGAPPTIESKPSPGKRRGELSEPPAPPTEVQAERSRLPNPSPASQPPTPAPRTNMAETALFLPDLRTDAHGHGTFTFLAPERLTSWRLKLWGLGLAAEAGSAEDTFETRKELMVRVETPRFVREGDRATLLAIVHNETDKAISAQVDLTLTDAKTGKPGAVEDFKRPASGYRVEPHGLLPVEHIVTFPEGLATYKVRATARAGALSDAEERELPILPSRERLIQSRVVALRGEEAKELVFDDLLQSRADPSLRNELMTVAIEPQLALAILRSIPFLIEYPYECVEQTLNRYVPLAIVNEVYRKHPELARAIASEPRRKTQHEPWLSNDPRRLVELTETPWLRQSQGGRDDGAIRDLLDPQLVGAIKQDALDKLEKMQRGDGSFPWFPGGPASFYMTLYVLENLAQLQDFGIGPPAATVARALAYVMGEMPRHLEKDEANVGFLAYGAYVVTSFDERTFPQVKAFRTEAARWMKHVMANRGVLTPFGRAWSARVMARLGDHAMADELLVSALDGAKTDPLIGTYWTPERYSWLWYADSVEKHAFFLRTLLAMRPQDPRIPGMAQWLLWNRKGNVWHSTKASAAAVYSLLDLLEKQGALKTPERFSVRWGKLAADVTVKPDDPRRDPLLFHVPGSEMTPEHGRVHIEKHGPGVAFASGTWIFSSTKLQPARKGDVVALERKFFRRVRRDDGDHLELLASGAKVHVGDDIEVRLAVTARSQLEYMQLREPRGAGFEETVLVSGYRWDKLAFYEEPRDSLVNFFIDWLPHGEYVVRHSLRPTTPGHYRIGSAVLQSMYSPDVAAYSSGFELEVLP